MLIFKAIIILLSYLITYYSYGVLVNKLLKRKEADFTTTILFGLFAYVTLFFIYAIPMHLTGKALHTTAAIWEVFWIASIVAIIVFCRETYAKPFGALLVYIKNNALNFTLLTVLTCTQIAFDEIYGRWSGSTNPSNYVAYVQSAVWYDKIGLYRSRSGILDDKIDGKLLTQTSLDMSAVVSKIFHVNPLVEIRYVTPAFMLIFGALSAWLLAREIFKEEKAKQWLFYVVYQLVYCITSFNVLLQGYYYYFRNYEGKTYNIAFAPIIFYVIYKLYKDPYDKKNLLLGVMCIVASFHYTGNGLYLYPICALGLVPAVFEKKSWFRQILNIFFLCLPCFVYAMYYIPCIKGMIPGLEFRN